MCADIAATSLLLATTPRSGSWLLSDYLAQTKVVGVPREYFHVNYVAALSSELGLSSSEITAEYVEELLRRSRGEQTLFATKVHWRQMNQLVSALRIVHPSFAHAPAPQLIEASLPGHRYLYLTRRNKARQAISMFLAMRTEHWWDSGGSIQEEPPALRPALDFLAVRWFEQDLQIEDAEWKRYFETFNIVPFTVVYEDLVADPSGVLQRILNWLDLPDVDVAKIQSRMSRQTDVEAERGLAEYLALREILPARPPGWCWSFGRRTFGLPDDPASTADHGARRGAMGDLTPF